MSWSDGKRVTATYATPRTFADMLPRPRHGRELDATRERITRPVASTPRRAQDWR